MPSKCSKRKKLCFKHWQLHLWWVSLFHSKYDRYQFFISSPSFSLSSKQYFLCNLVGFHNRILHSCIYHNNLPIISYHRWTHGGAIERPIPARWLMGTWSELKIIQLNRRFFVMRIIDPMLNGWLEVVSTRERSIGGRSWKKQLRLEGEEEDCAYVTANLNSRETKWVLPLGFVEGSRERVCVFLEMMKEWQETVE